METKNTDEKSKKGLNKPKDIPNSWIGRLSIVRI